MSNDDATRRNKVTGTMQGVRQVLALGTLMFGLEFTFLMACEGHPADLVVACIRNPLVLSKNFDGYP